MKIAIVGATGLVGRTIINELGRFNMLFNNDIYLYASQKSAGSKLCYGKRAYIVEELNEQNLKPHYDIVLFSAGSRVSFCWAEKFVQRGAFVIDNSSAFRREANVPLVVPEINFKEIDSSTRIIANPNCSTIGASLPIFALSRLGKIKRIIVSTYQAVSGAGNKAIMDMTNNTTDKLPCSICNNLIPQIDVPMENGYTFEEDKMEFELKKILKLNDLKVCATCVRVPIKNCHSESINIEFDNEISITDAKNVLNSQPGVVVFDDLKNGQYPMPIIADGKDDVFVGRIRKDTSNKNAINIFVCFDNIKKGAALNAVQIASLVSQNILKL